MGRFLGFARTPKGSNLAARVESFEENIEQLKRVLPLQYAELGLNNDKLPLDPRWNLYIQQERNGELLFVTLRDAGELVGYFVGFVAPALHNANCLTCIQDFFFLRKDKRGAMAGNKLFAFIEAELKRRGVQRLITDSNNRLPAAWLFKRRGYQEIETIHTLWLGD